MEIIKNNRKLDLFLNKIRKKGIKIGLIPTMGGIHKGHLSLVDLANKYGFFSLVTIYINPTQFNDLHDFKDYPRNVDKDIKTLKNTDCKLIFFPSNTDLYADNIKSEKTIFEYRDILCDKFRPNHFDGVTTVVKKLFNLIKPDGAFFGEKDFQQLKLIQKLAENNKMPTKIYPCKSIRMSNAMSYSSRFNNFQDSQKKVFNKASFIITKRLNELKKNIDLNILTNLKKDLEKITIKKIDYIEIRDEIYLLPSIRNKASRLFISFYINKIRIVDNFKLY